MQAAGMVKGHVIANKIHFPRFRVYFRFSEASFPLNWSTPPIDKLNSFLDPETLLSKGIGNDG